MYTIVLVILLTLQRTQCYTVLDLLTDVNVTIEGLPLDLEVHPYKPLNGSILDNFNAFESGENITDRIRCYIYFSNMCYYIHDVDVVHCLDNMVHNGTCMLVHPDSAHYVLNTIYNKCGETLNPTYYIYEAAGISSIAEYIFANKIPYCPVDWWLVISISILIIISGSVIGSYTYVLYKKLRPSYKCKTRSRFRRKV